MPKANEIDPTKDISLLLKGPPGEGKTIAASTFCIFGDIIIFYIDKNNPVELQNFYRRLGRLDLLERIEYRTYSSHNINQYLNDLIEIQTRYRGKYVAGITDSVTTLTTAAVNWHMGFNSASRDESKIKIPGFDEYKTETSLVTQALDICKGLPWYNIWTAHPLPSLEVKGQGSSVQSVKTVNHIVSYGQKVGAMVPAQFTEIYHFSRQTGNRTVWTNNLGEDYAKTAYSLPRSFSIEDKLFAEVWLELVNKGMNGEFDKPEVKNDSVNPFENQDAKPQNRKWSINKKT